MDPTNRLNLAVAGLEKDLEKLYNAKASRERKVGCAKSMFLSCFDWIYAILYNPWPLVILGRVKSSFGQSPCFLKKATLFQVSCLQKLTWGHGGNTSQSVSRSCGRNFKLQKRIQTFGAGRRVRFPADGGDDNHRLSVNLNHKQRVKSPNTMVVR